MTVARAVPAVAPRLLRHLLDRIVPATFWLLVALSKANTLSHALKSDAGRLEIAHLAANTAFILLAAALFLIRRSTVGRRSRPIEAAVAIAGTFALTFLAVLPTRHDAPLILTTGTALVVLGLLWSLVSLAALGRCFGVFPEARGLVTRGPYRLVRHPLYLGEIVMGLGMLLPVLSPASAAIWLAFAALQIWRAINEERALARVFPEYGEYRARTRRLIPYVW